MKTLIAIPAMSWVYTDFMQCMIGLETTPEDKLYVQKNSLIYDARNNIAAAAIKYEFDRVFWLDSDMMFAPDTLTKLKADMDGNGLDYVCGFFTGRSIPAKPCVYKSIRYEDNGKEIISKAESVTEHPAGLFEVAGSGFGGVLMKTELIKAVGEKYGLPFMPLPYLGEDMAFCWRAAQLGRRMYCDGAVQMGHIGTAVFREDMNV